MKAFPLMLRCATLLGFCTAIRVKGTCSAVYFGRPDSHELAQIISILPGKLQPSDIDASALRTFLEPGICRPRFTQVENETPNERMIQLPRLWRYGDARIALLAVADSSGLVSFPVFISSWDIILSAVSFSIAQCKGTDVQVQRGGFAVIYDDEDRKLAAIYIYDALSPFVEILNWYMVEVGGGIDPFNIPDQVRSHNSVSASNTTNGYSSSEKIDAEDDLPFAVLPEVSGAIRASTQGNSVNVTSNSTSGSTLPGLSMNITGLRSDDIV